MRSGMWLASYPLETIQIQVCLMLPVTMAITCHLGMCFLVSENHEWVFSVAIKSCKVTNLFLRTALSGQDVDVNTKSVSFSPKIKSPFKLPFMIPTVWGSLESEITNRTHLQYTLSLEYGELEIMTLTAGGCLFPNNGRVTMLTVNSPLQWNCPYQV